MEMKGNQRTFQAAMRQIQAMAVPVYDVGLHGPDGSMEQRTWQSSEIAKSMAWLRHKNGLGHDIFVRPSDSLGVILLDDLCVEAISALQRDGLMPAAIVETSPDNYQCWIRLILNQQHQQISTKAIRVLTMKLASLYGADPRSTDWRHFGRLAGFTNRKPCHSRQGRYPFVLLRQATAIVAPNGRQWLIDAYRQATTTRPEMTLHSAPTPPYIHNLSYLQRAQRILRFNQDKPWTLNPDLSRMDLMIAREKLREGCSPKTVARFIKDGSPDLARRKRGHLNDYLQRTINRALHDTNLYPAPLQRS